MSDQVDFDFHQENYQRHPDDDQELDDRGIIYQGDELEEDGEETEGIGNQQEQYMHHYSDDENAHEDENEEEAEEEEQNLEAYYRKLQEQRQLNEEKKSDSLEKSGQTFEMSDLTSNQFDNTQQTRLSKTHEQIQQDMDRVQELQQSRINKEGNKQVYLEKEIDQIKRVMNELEDSLEQSSQRIFAIDTKNKTDFDRQRIAADQDSRREKEPNFYKSQKPTGSRREEEMNINDDLITEYQKRENSLQTRSPDQSDPFEHDGISASNRDQQFHYFRENLRSQQLEREKELDIEMDLQRGSQGNDQRTLKLQRANPAPHYVNLNRDLQENNAFNQEREVEVRIQQGSSNKKPSRDKENQYSAQKERNYEEDVLEDTPIKPVYSKENSSQFNKEKSKYVNQLSEKADRIMDGQSDYDRYEKTKFQNQVSRRKENRDLQNLETNEKFVLNQFDNDQSCKNLRRERQYDQIVQNVRSQVFKNLDNPVQNKSARTLLESNAGQLANQNKFQKDPLIRGPRDQLEIQIFGHRKQCRECAFLLSKGLTTNLCQDHGTVQRQEEPTRQVPKRLEKFL